MKLHNLLFLLLFSAICANGSKELNSEFAFSPQNLPKVKSAILTKFVACIRQCTDLPEDENAECLHNCVNSSISTHQS